MKKLAMLGLTAILVLSLVIAGCTDSDDEEEEEELEPAPNFTLTSIDGDTFSLTEFDDKVVILDFMYVACQYCDDEMGELKKVFSNYDDNDVVIITIDILPDEDNETELRQFGEDYGDDWIYALDTDNVWNDYTEGQEGVPKIVIITKDGKISYEDNGLVSYSTLSAEIDKLL
ncbi:MAG: TlpA family protein disulfide reductase [Thermoplasmata archaeon]|nr:MAG: TlpA family protein disulfide reductase [Thermoplasmata archaeon]